MRTSKHTKRNFGYCASILSLLISTHGVYGSEDCTTDAMLIFDGSGSMAEMGFNGLDEPRIVEARRAMRSSLPAISIQRNLGLIVYGPGSEDLCKNIDVRFEPIPDAAPRVVSEIDALTPFGNTPLTQSILKAAEVLEYQQKPGEIVLVTDGKETCGGATCQLAAKLAAESHQLTIHVIGFQVRGDYFAWRSQDNHGDYTESETVAKCLAEFTGGQYLATQNAEELAAAMDKTLGCAVIGRL